MLGNGAGYARVRCEVFLGTAAKSVSVFFFFNDTATTEIYTLSLHDALPILEDVSAILHIGDVGTEAVLHSLHEYAPTYAVRGNEIGRHTSELQSPVPISYAVFCLKKKKNTQRRIDKRRRLQDRESR